MVEEAKSPKPRKFRKKPILVTAVQWKPNPYFGTWRRGHYVNRRVGLDQHGVVYTITDVTLPTIEGAMFIHPGSWIVTGVMGERYAVRKDIFEATYEPAD